jgi:hypothetical protein
MVNTLAQTGVANAAFLENIYACRVMVLYEDAAAHERAMEVCARLSGQFNGELSFAFASCSFPGLSDPAIARESLDAAALADVLLFSTRGAVPQPTRQWLENCIARRNGREGALALLLNEPPDPATSLGAVLSWFEHAAARSKMDFLPLLPKPAQELFNEIASDEVVVAPSLPPMLDAPRSHWGLNE